jgi:hypothetical protein
MSKEGVAMEAGGTMLALLNKAPHPNAAVMINWFLRARDRSCRKASPTTPVQLLREDIPKDEFPPGRFWQKNVNTSGCGA